MYHVTGPTLLMSGAITASAVPDARPLASGAALLVGLGCLLRVQLLDKAPAHRATVGRHRAGR